MMKKVAILAVFVLFLAACVPTHKIDITSEGYSQKELKIKAGETITWTNKDSVEHWPASAMHPTHLVYPESGGCIGSKFDACKGLTQGESWSFTFNQKGEWWYHDHIYFNNSNYYGKIIIE